MTTNSEFRGLKADSWDALRGDTSRWADRFFFLDVIRDSGQPVLDVGCGTGRLLLDYLSQGIDIEGVDNSPEMLALCRKKAKDSGLSPTLYEQAMESLDLPRRYRTILVPSSSLQLLVEQAAAQQAMAAFVRHLEPGGTLAAPFMTLWREGDPLTHRSEQTADREDGSQVRHESRAWYDPKAGCETTEDLYQVIRDGKVILEERRRRRNATRSYTQAEARTLFEEAGLVDIRLYRGFTFEPAGPEDTLFSLTGRRT